MTKLIRHFTPRTAIVTLLAIIAVAAAVLWAGPGAGVLAAPAAATPVPSPRHADPATAPRAPIAYPAAAGPFIDAPTALATARRLASGPITREAIGRIPYAAASAWMGSATYTIDPARQVYLVVVQAPFSPPRANGLVSCSVYFAVVDATDGSVFADGCRDFSGAWPALPAGVQ